MERGGEIISKNDAAPVTIARAGAGRGGASSGDRLEVAALGLLGPRRLALADLDRQFDDEGRTTDVRHRHLEALLGSHHLLDDQLEERLDVGEGLLRRLPIGILAAEVGDPPEDLGDTAFARVIDDLGDLFHVIVEVVEVAVDGLNHWWLHVRGQDEPRSSWLS